MKFGELLYSNEAPTRRKATRIILVVCGALALVWMAAQVGVSAANSELNAMEVAGSMSGLDPYDAAYRDIVGRRNIYNAIGAYALIGVVAFGMVAAFLKWLVPMDSAS